MLLVNRSTDPRVIFFILLFLFRHPHNVTIAKDDFKMARKPKETARLMLRGLSHLSTTNTIE